MRHAGYSIAGAIVLSAVAGGSAFAQEVTAVFEGKGADPVVCDGVAKTGGRWTSRKVQVLEEGNTLELREYDVFDPEPDRALDFLWKPDNSGQDRSGRISGPGLLTWRDHAHMAWDPAGVVKSFRGTLRQGKPEGDGEFISQDGVDYDGAWHDGRPEGYGWLTLPSGEFYTGAFRSGCAEGHGTFVEATGERFEGPFRDGQRDGTGKTTLPDGFSYTSRWARGIEEPGSRRTRLAQLGTTTGLPGSDIRMGVTVQRKPKLPDDVNVGNVIAYEARPVAGGLQVQPSNRELLDAWKKDGEIQTSDDGDVHSGIFYYDDGFVKSTSPTFLIDVRNSTPQRMEITSFRVDVKESGPDLQPAVQMKFTDHTSCGPSFQTSATLENYGWSPANGVRVSYTLTNAAAGDVSGLTGGFNVGDVRDRKEMSFNKSLQSFGIDIQKLKGKNDYGDYQGLEFLCKGGNLDRCLENIRDDKVFGRAGALLSHNGPYINLGTKGNVSYTWSDDKGESHDRVSPFRFTLELAHFRVLSECGEGGGSEPIRQSPFQLRVSGTNYSLAVPYDKSVQAGQTARFTFRLIADQSSKHKFTIVAVLSDGREIVSQPVSMLFFRPRKLPSNF